MKTGYKLLWALQVDNHYFESRSTSLNDDTAKRIIKMPHSENTLVEQ